MTEARSPQVNYGDMSKGELIALLSKRKKSEVAIGKLKEAVTDALEGTPFDESGNRDDDSLWDLIRDMPEGRAKERARNILGEITTALRLCDS